MRRFFVAEFIDGTNGHHHDLNLRAGSKVTDITQLGRVVDEEVEWSARVKGFQVVGGGLDCVVNAFLDCHRGHHNDELGKAVPLVQLKYSAQIDVGLPGAGFHFHGEISRGERGRGCEAVAELDGV